MNHPDTSHLFLTSFLRRHLLALSLIALIAVSATAQAAPEGTQSVATPYSFTDLTARLERSIEANGLVVVASASASRGAASRGVTIPGNLVLMVFRNDFAVRMLEASVPAGIEAPLRFYLTENADQSATLSWRSPSAVFAPYGSPQLDALVHELDTLFDAIVRDATR